jgi:hypothetical protein
MSMSMIIALLVVIGLCALPLVMTYLGACLMVTRVGPWLVGGLVVFVWVGLPAYRWAFPPPPSPMVYTAPYVPAKPEVRELSRDEKEILECAKSGFVYAECEQYVYRY